MAFKDDLLYVTSWWENLVYVYQVPEPTSFLLLLAGAALVGFRKRKRVQA